jgi:pimeloyl-ACP methyl ester carboxylesterase
MELSEHGRPGERRRIWSTIRQHVAEVRDRTAALGPRTVLVGHSMGGLIVQRALERSEAAGAVLLASMPGRGALPPALRLLRRQPVPMLHALCTINMWPIVGSEPLARRAFFSARTPDDTVASTFARLQNESFRSFVNMMLRPSRPSRVSTPVHVIAAELDGFFTLAEQRDLAQAYGVEPYILVGSGHNVMLDGSWSEAADEVLRWARTLDTDAHPVPAPAPSPRVGPRRVPP